MPLLPTVFWQTTRVVEALIGYLHDHDIPSPPGPTPRLWKPSRRLALRDTRVRGQSSRCRLPPPPRPRWENVPVPITSIIP